jgi:hypothetical protein
MFACDSDCPNWKGMKICSHSVAVAEMSGKLAEYIEKFKKNNKTPNITKFAETTMPKGRGKKGDEQPRKRKSSQLVQVRIENPSLASPPIDNDSSTQSSPQSRFTTLSPALLQSQYFHPPMYAPWQYPPYPSVPSYHQPSSLPSMPFQLCKISGNISIWVGCRNKYK